ncbi:MAG: elongation factor Ts, partial [Sphingomonadales bacterium]|nr:elongation factor Ts [Sphingomonadales bacterium]
QEFVRTVAGLALAGSGTVEGLLAAQWPAGGTVEEKLTANIATIGENQSLRRAALLEVGDGVVVSYVHNSVSPGLGKIGVLVALESTGDKAALEALGKQLAMHIAAANPLALRGEDLDAAMIERERSIATEKAKESGKPADIVAKMVDGAIAKFRKEMAFMSQLFVIDNKTKIEDVLAAEAKKVGAPISVAGFVRFQLGEGIEKKVDDFAAEVAAASGVAQKPEPVE